MSPIDSVSPEERELAPSTVALLTAIAQSTPPKAPPPAPSLELLVRYVGRAVSPEEAEAVDRAAGESDDVRSRLVNVWRTVKQLQRRPWAEVVRLSDEDSAESQIARAWMAVAARPAPSPREGLAELLRRGAEGARTALTVLRAAVSAEQFPRGGLYAGLSPALRAGAPRVLVEDERMGGELALDASPGHLELRARNPEAVEGRAAFVTLRGDANDVRLGSGVFHDGALRIETVDEALLAHGQLVVRFGDWPSQSEQPVLVFAVGDPPHVAEPFATLVETPQIVRGRLRMRVALDDSVPADGSGALRVDCALQPDDWQLLGEEVLAGRPPDPIEISFEAPGPEGPFDWPLRLHWRIL